jgi:hypothetical protein
MTQPTRTDEVVHSPYNPATGEPLATLRHVRTGRLYQRPSIVALIALVALVHPLGAQMHLGAVSGVVKDSGGIALSNVEVMVMRSGRAVRTDSVGHFLLASIVAGHADIGFRRVAYEPVIVSLQIPLDDTTDVEVRLGGVTPLLPAVVINDHVERSRVLQEFESRRKTGAGYFVTRADIERRRPHALSDYMRIVPGVRIMMLDNGRTALRFARNARASCPPQYFVDGIPTSNFDIDEVLPGDVEGVELYAGSAGVPPQFNRFYGTTICGTILIWTRIPGKENEKS